jgi:hypothetical protein
MDYNDYNLSRRWDLATMVSRDGGSTWENPRLLEFADPHAGQKKLQYCYPSLLFNDGVLHLTYYGVVDGQFFNMLYQRLESDWFTKNIGVREELKKPKPKDEWISLFNGKNLDGWEGDPEIWRVEDGYIYGSGKTSYKSYLINRTHILKDFILEVKFMPVKGNSGVNYRSGDYDADPGKPYEVSGYQCDIGPMGDLYDIYTTGNNKRYATVKGQACKCEGVVSRTEWNTFRIVANGRNLSHEINGTPCIEFQDNDALGFREKGFIALEFHDSRVKVKFKDIRVKILNQ